MKIAVPKEIKNNECRVGLTPNSVQYLMEEGHQLYIESNAGINIGFTDEDSINAGAEIIHNKKELFETANIIILTKHELRFTIIIFYEISNIKPSSRCYHQPIQHFFRVPEPLFHKESTPQYTLSQNRITIH